MLLSIFVFIRSCVIDRGDMFDVLFTFEVAIISQWLKIIIWLSRICPSVLYLWFNLICRSIFNVHRHSLLDIINWLPWRVVCDYHTVDFIWFFYDRSFGVWTDWFTYHIWVWHFFEAVLGIITFLINDLVSIIIGFILRNKSQLLEMVESLVGVFSTLLDFHILCPSNIFKGIFIYRIQHSFIVIRVDKNVTTLSFKVFYLTFREQTLYRWKCKSLHLDHLNNVSLLNYSLSRSSERPLHPISFTTFSITRTTFRYKISEVFNWVLTFLSIHW